MRLKFAAATALVIAASVGMTARAQSANGLVWVDPPAELSAMEGGVESGSFRFTTDAVGELELKVTGNLMEVLAVDDELVEPVGVGTYDVPWTLTLDPTVKALKSSYNGHVHVKVDGKTLRPKLDLRVVPREPAADVIPGGISEPAPGRIVLNDRGLPVVIDELIVGLSFDIADPTARILEIATEHDLVFVGAVERGRLYQLQLPGGDVAAIRALAVAIAGAPDVNFAEPHYVDAEPSVEPDDSEWDDWDVDNPGGNNWGLEFIDAPAAWDVTTGSNDVDIAIIDGDLDQNHSDLNDNIAKIDNRGPKDWNGHGTHVAGTACAEGDNDKGISGVAWDCTMRLYGNRGSRANLAADMIQAVDDGARVVNMSLALLNGNDSTFVPTDEEVAEAHAVFAQGILYAQFEDEDVLWVMAAGNATRDAALSSPGGMTSQFPTNVMSIASLDRDGGLRASSNRGDLIDVAAPGQDIFSTVPRQCTIGFLGFTCDDKYDDKSGTSMAAPHVTGLAALIMTNDPDLTAADVKGCIVSSSQTSGEEVAGHDFSVINAPAALSCGTLELPPEVDLVFSLDLTGSMGGVLGQAKAEVDDVIADLEAAAPATDFQFAVVSYEDYDTTVDASGCALTDYSARYGSSGDEPFRIDQTLTDDGGAVAGAVNGLSLGSGADGPESYGRAFWELGQSDTGTTLGFRPDALKIIVNFGDNLPHDPNVNEGTTIGGVRDTGLDLGRNGVLDCGPDDIDFQDDALAALIDAEVRLLHVDSGGGLEQYWRPWTSLTGGAYTELGERSLTDVIVELIELIP